MSLSSESSVLRTQGSGLFAVPSAVVLSFQLYSALLCTRGFSVLRGRTPGPSFSPLHKERMAIIISNVIVRSGFHRGEGAMARVKDGDIISLHYTGSLDDGTVFDTSEQGSPLSFTVGAGEVIQGFEEGVRGMEIGETREFDIAPEQAYGEYHEDLVRVVPRSAFPPNIAPEMGLGFELELPSGQTLPVRIIDVEGDEVTLDANHLLAGETLTFKIRLLSIDLSAEPAAASGS